MKHIKKFNESFINYLKDLPQNIYSKNKNYTDKDIADKIKDYALSIKDPSKIHRGGTPYKMRGKMALFSFTYNKCIIYCYDNHLVISLSEADGMEKIDCDPSIPKEIINHFSNVKTLYEKEENIKRKNNIKSEIRKNIMGK